MKGKEEKGVRRGKERKGMETEMRPGVVVNEEKKNVYPLLAVSGKRKKESLPYFQIM